MWEREAHINWSMVTCQGIAKAAPVWNDLEICWPCADGLSAVNAIGTQLRDPINPGLTRWRVVVVFLTLTDRASTKPSNIVIYAIVWLPVVSYGGLNK